jgi:hypothetical protein
MNKLHCAIIALAICIASCSDNRNNFALQKELNKSIVQSNAAIRSQSEWVYESMEKKMLDPEKSVQLGEWNARAAKVKELSLAILKHISELKQELINKAGFDPFDDSNKKSGPAGDVVRKVFSELKEGQLLHEKLAIYKHDLLYISDDIRGTFTGKLSITGTDQVSNEQAFTNRYFNSTLADALSMLNKLENEVAIAENQVARFCNERIFMPDGYIFFDTYASVVVPSARTVKPGEKIEFLAALTAFPRIAMPAFVFAGQEVSIGEEGSAVYQIKAPLKPGVYTMPVQITYVTQRGDTHVIQQNVEYTVQ